MLASLGTAVGVTISNAAAVAGLPKWTQILALTPISAGLVFAAVHWSFSKFGWRVLCWISEIPHIGGDWICSGERRNLDGEVVNTWDGDIHIVQNWEKIRVSLKTKQSSSYSISAALLPEGDGCWMLMYSYKNEPRVGEAELLSHVGYCELRFDRNIKVAEGDYFNARGRGTFGRMSIRRK